MAQDISSGYYNRAATRQTKRAPLHVDQIHQQQTDKALNDTSKMNYLMSMGYLGDSTRGDDSKGAVQKFDTKGTQVGQFGDNKERWGVRVNEQLQFFNPNSPDQPEIKSNTPNEIPKVADINEDIYEDVPVIGKRPIKENMPIPEISNQFNFDLGDAAATTGYDDWMKAMGPDKQKEWENYVQTIQDPEVLAQVGKFQFKSGTDATPMSKSSRERYQNKYDEALMSDDETDINWMIKNGINTDANGMLNDKAMQHMLGYERFTTQKKFTEEALKRQGSNSKYDDLFDPYTKDNHTLGKKKYNEAERYSSVTNKAKVKSIEKVVGEEEYETGKERRKVGTRSYSTVDGKEVPNTRREKRNG